MRLVVLLILASMLGYGVFQLDKIDPDNYVKMYIGHYVIEVKVLGFLILVPALGSSPKASVDVFSLDL